MTASSAPFDSQHSSMFEDEPDRTSIAAVLSLVLGLLGCCTAVTAPIGLALAIIGIIGITKSNSRVGGMGFAVAGLIISLLSLMLWIGAVFGAFGLLKEMDTHVSKPTAQIFLDLQSDNFDSARAGLAMPAAAATDEQLAAFRDAYLANTGELVSTPASPGEYISGWAQLIENMQVYQGRNDAIPIPMVFANGTGLVVMFFDQNSTQQSGTLVPMDLAVFDAAGNRVELSEIMFPALGSTQMIDPADDEEAQEQSSESTDDASSETQDAESDGP